MADDSADEPADAPVVADDPADEPADEPAMAEEPADGPTETLITSQAPSELRGDWIIGTTVNSPQDETIGQVQDLIIDEEAGKVTAAVLSVGGFLGIGAKNIAVNWDELQIDFDGQEIVLNLTREEAEDAPEYEFRDQAELPAAAPEAGMDAAPPPVQ
ncbi:hypothetical protein BH23PSE1_BH23PSE1_15890 [soil metagenome]